jgi:CHAD domain-containing protein
MPSVFTGFFQIRSSEGRMERPDDPSSPAAPPADATPAAPARTEPPRTSGELAFAVLRRQRERLLGHEVGTRLGQDPEALHGMRVATRRLRAALAVFADSVPRRGERVRRELGWLGRSLGELRDLDVQLGRLAAEAGNDAALDPAALAVSAVLMRRRERTRRRMLRVLDSRRYVRLLESLGALVDGGPRARGVARRPSALVAPDGLTRAYKKVRKAAERLKPDTSAEELHRLRILTKRLRYALEFHAGLYGRPAEEIIARLILLQDQLGVHQDCHVMLGLIDEIRSENGKRLPAEALFAMGTLAERVARHAARVRRELPRQFAGVRGKPWKRVKHAFDTRLAAAVRPRRRPKPARKTGDTAWTTTTTTNRPKRHSTLGPPTSTAS